ncbi:MAG TPA: pseudouridine synthase [Flavipsychrobacter sp.]|jgi:23S rRNA pseudouridine2605 synthase|nr:pseudouridine synthase [Flavipsychrobacter sp.]
MRKNQDASYHKKSNSKNKDNKNGASRKSTGSDENKSFSKERGAKASYPKRSFDKEGKREFSSDKPKGSFNKGTSEGAGDRPARSFDKKPFDKRSGPRDFKRNDGPDKGEKRSFSDRPKRSFEKKSDEEGSDRPKRNFDKKPFDKRKDDRDFKKSDGSDKGEKRSFSDRPKRSFDKRSSGEDTDRKKRSFDKKPFDKRSDDRDFKKSDGSDKGEKRSFSDRPKRSFDKRSSGEDTDRPKRSFDKKPFDKRSDDRDFRKSDGSDKGEKRSFSDRPKRSFDKRSPEDGNDRPKRNFRSDDSKEGGVKKKSFDKKPFDKRKDDRFSKEDKYDKKSDRKGKHKKEEGEEREKLPDFKKELPEVDTKVRRSYATTEEKSIDSAMTLNKYIAHSGECSRRDAAEMVKQGKVRVNGELILEPGYRVEPGDQVTLSGKKLTPQKNLSYILLNKPKGFLTTTEDPEDRKTVMDLVESAGVDRLFPVGRLDRNTTGVLLLTNDGALAHRLSHPSYNMKKVYHVTLDKNLTRADYEKIAKGLELEDGFIQVDEIAYLENRHEVGLEIHSGKNRIVRRIFESLGYQVEKLDRVMYAGLTKKNVSRGKWRFLDEKEIIFLKHFKG